MKGIMKVEILSYQHTSDLGKNSNGLSFRQSAVWNVTSCLILIRVQPSKNLLQNRLLNLIMHRNIVLLSFLWNLELKNQDLKWFLKHLRTASFQLKWGYPIIFASNVFHNSHLIQKCIQNQQLLWKTFDAKMILDSITSL